MQRRLYKSHRGFKRNGLIRYRAVWEREGSAGAGDYTAGLACRRVQLDAPPEKIAELLHSAFSTGAALGLVFDAERRGKCGCFAVRRESGTIRKRPWSGIFSALVP